MMLEMNIVIDDDDGDDDDDDVNKDWTGGVDFNEDGDFDVDEVCIRC